MALEKTAIFAGYIPVIHQGYIEAFDRHPDAKIGVFDESITSFLSYLRKDIRALKPSLAANVIRGLGREAFVLTRSALEESLHTDTYAMPDDDLTREVERRYPNARIIKEPIFLRWDRDASTTNTEVIPDREITLLSDHPIIRIVEREKSESTNWWRHIGAVVIGGYGEIVSAAHNSPVPTQHSSWIDGDPRITAQRGESIERSIDMHAEAAVIANAARNGEVLYGTDLYVSTFPCPNCAKLIAECGIKSCYFVEGYAMVDGLEILKANDVEIVKINVPDLPPEDNRTLKAYS